MPLGFAFSPIYVDQIAHRLEEIERHACGQQNLYGQRMHGQPSCLRQRIEPVDYGRAQLEYKENTHKRQDAAEKTAFFTGAVGGFFKAEGQKIGEGCGKKEQKAVGHM